MRVCVWVCVWMCVNVWQNMKYLIEYTHPSCWLWVIEVLQRNWTVGNYCIQETRWYRRFPMWEQCKLLTVSWRLYFVSLTCSSVICSSVPHFYTYSPPNCHLKMPDMCSASKSSHRWFILSADTLWSAYDSLPHLPLVFVQLSHSQ
jgi:hypothetical protein